MTLVPRDQPVGGRAIDSNLRPSILRNNTMPGADCVVMAKSIQPSLLKSKEVMEVADFAVPGNGFDAAHFPSRGLVKSTGAPDSLVTTMSTARSLFTSLAMAAVPLPLKVRAVSAVTSVKVLLPLLRKSWP